MYGKPQLASQVDAAELDKLANTGNLMAMTNQLENMVMFLGLTAKFFDYVDNNKCRAICEQLQKKGYGLAECKVAFDKIRDTCQKFPSFVDILSLMPKRTSKDTKAIEAHNAICKSEQDLCEKIELKFVEVFGNEKLESFCQWWVKECMQVSNSELEKWGMNFLLFKNSALLDWHDSYYTTKFERLKDVVLKKSEELTKIQSKNIQNERAGRMQVMQLTRINKNLL